MIITIDGPSGTGKTTVAQQVAQKLGITYFDTGAMYRSFTYMLLEQAISPQNAPLVKEALKNFSFEIRLQNKVPHYFVGGTDVTSLIRSQAVTSAVSEVSALRIVRKAMWKRQRAYAASQSAVFEGRDMGSVVFPKAEVKIFLDASPKVRAKRRLQEMKEKQPTQADGLDEESMEKELLRRDTFDSKRELAPLKCPKGALKIDTSNLTIDQVVALIIVQYQKQSAKLYPSWLRSKKMAPLYRLVLILSWCILRGLYRYKVYGLEHFVKRAAIIAPNHTSYMDPPIVAVSWPEEVHFLAKETLFRSHFGRLISALNSHPVKGDVADLGVFKTLVQLLKEGKQVVVFPEGGRTDGTLQPIKPGIGMLALRGQAAIVPTYIAGAFEVWSRDRKFPKPFGKVSCVFGTPIPSESFAHLEKKQAQEEIAKALTSAILNLKAWLEAGAHGVPP